MFTQQISPLQMQFYATTTHQITILPNYKSEQKVYLMGQYFGPVKPNQPLVVPLWLAIFLKQQQKCKIQIPLQYSSQNLKNWIDRQNQRDNNQDPIFLYNNNFFQIAYTLLNRTPDSFIKPRQIRSLIESLQTIRFQKMRKLIQKTNGGRRLKYFTSYQINKWRNGLSKLEKMVDKLIQVGEKIQ